MLYGDRVDRTIPPRTGRDQVLRIIHALLDAPRLPTRRAHGAVDRCWRRRSGPSSAARWWSSSPTSSAPPAGSGRSRCSPGATRCSRCASTTRAERTLPDVGLLVMADAETGEQLVVDTSDRGVPRAVRGRGVGSARRAWRPRSGRPASRRSRWPRTTTWCAPSCAWRTAGPPGTRRVMTFLWPWMLLLLLGVPLLAAGLSGHRATTHDADSRPSAWALRTRQAVRAGGRSWPMSGATCPRPSCWPAS